MNYNFECFIAVQISAKYVIGDPPDLKIPNPQEINNSNS